jgi:uncharacterized membrane protein YozB (DUF420 family)
LGTNAPLISDITLILMLLTALLFTLGWRLAVRRRYKAHRRVETTKKPAFHQLQTFYADFLCTLYGRDSPGCCGLYCRIYIWQIVAHPGALG